MDEKQVTIGEIISGIAIRMKRLGYEESTIDRNYFLCIAHFYFVIPKKWLSRKPQEDGVFLISPAAFFGITF